MKQVTLGKKASGKARKGGGKAARYDVAVSHEDLGLYDRTGHGNETNPFRKTCPSLGSPPPLDARYIWQVVFFVDVVIG